MSQKRELSGAMKSRLEALQTRHAQICRRLDEAYKHPAFTDTEARRLKTEKLRLKDEMEELRQAS